MIALLLQRIITSENKYDIKIKFMMTQFSPTLRINDKSLLKQRTSENSIALIMLTVMNNLFIAS